MAIPSDWQPHHDSAGILLGWLEPADDGFVVHDRLGRPRSGALTRAEAESELDRIGLPLDVPLELRLSRGAPESEHWIRVRLAADRLVDDDRIWLRAIDHGTQGGPPVEHYLVRAPMPPVLREAASA